MFPIKPLRFLFFFFCLWLYVIPGGADERDRSVDQALTLAAEKRAGAQTWEGQNTDQPFISLLNEYEIKVEPDLSYTETYHVRVKVQQESAKELGEWPIYYNKSREEITEVKAYVETPQGRKVSSTHMQDLEVYNHAPMYSDMKVKVVSLPQVNVGSVIDVTVKTKALRKEIPGHFWDEIPYPASPTKYARHTYIFPEDQKVEVKHFREDHKTIVEKQEGAVKYSFIFEETEPLREEEMMPVPDEIRGGLFLSTIHDWKIIADWYRDLMKKNTISSSEIEAKTLSLIQDKPTLREKARAIFEFIQDDFRYVSMSFGDHTVEPHATDVIFKNRYGDCKDLALLAKQMLQIAGMTSHICLLSGEFSGDPRKALPSPVLFEHVILELDFDGQRYFVDPRIRGFGFGELPSGYDNAHVLVITDEGFRFDNLPIAGETGRSVISESQAHIRPDGSAIFDARVLLPLEASQGFRDAWKSSTDENKKQFLELLEARFSQGGTMLSHELKGLENRYGPVELNLKYESPAAYPLVNDMILVKEADPSDIPEFSASQRTYSIFLPTNALIENVNIYHVPEGFEVDFLPKDYALAIDFIDVRAQYAARGDTVSVHTTYRMQRATVLPERYPEVKNFRNALYQKNEQYVVLKKKKP